nr:MAG TPA: hypothetical protein [Caudoviricetes sp.]
MKANTESERMGCQKWQPFVFSLIPRESLF